jgi:hypothetical protein
LAGRCETQAERAAHCSRVERVVTGGLENLYAIDAPSILHTNAKERLAFHVLIPHVKRILDRHLTEQRLRLFDFAVVPTPSEGDQYRPRPYTDPPNSTG